MKIALSFFLILISTSDTFGQTDKVDSLKNVLTTSISDDQIMELNYNISFIECHEHPDSGVLYGRRALNLAYNLGAENKKADYHSQLAFSYHLKKNIDSSFHHWEIAGDTYVNNDQDFHAAQTYENLAISHIFQGKYEKAIVLLDTARHYYYLIDTIQKNFIDLNYALYYDFKGDYDTAFHYYINAYKFVDSINDVYRKGLVNSNLSAMFYYMEKDKEAIAYGKKALKDWSENQYKKDHLDALVNVALAYERLGYIDSSIYYSEEALFIAKEKNIEWAQGNLNHNLGALYVDQGQIEKGLHYLQKAKSIKIQASSREGSASTYLELAAAYAQNGDTRKALSELEKGKEITMQVGAIDEIKEMHQLESEVYANLNDYKSALESYKSYGEVKDSVLNLETTSKVEELKIQYETEKKELENKLLYSEVATKNATISSQRALIGLGTLGLCTLLIVLTTYNQRKKTAERQAKIEEELRLTKEREAELLSEENQRLVESNDGLTKRIKGYETDIDSILNESWTINPKGRKQLQVKLGDILAISTSTEKANTLEYLLKDSNSKPLERRTMKNMENDPNLLKEVFMRVHQSHIVNLHNIASIDSTSRVIHLNYTEDVIQVSDTYLDDLQVRYAALRKAAS